MICLVYAHPYPDRSRANRVLLDAVRDLDGLAVRSLYDLYPDFGIDVDTEQHALRGARLIVLQHPMYWYSVPGLMKHYFDKVLVRGFAYGEGGDALHGKTCLWVATTGGETGAYAHGAQHGLPFEAYAAPMAQVARFCGMEFAEPLIVHGAHRQPAERLDQIAHDYRARLSVLASEAA